MKILGIVCFLFVTSGCQSKTETQAGDKQEKTAFPYKKIVSSPQDPADNGPDDSTELGEMKGTAGKIRFPHFSHASNKESGFSIPCQRCHHKTPKGKYPEDGCRKCHPVPLEVGDLANLGPENNLVLRGTLGKAAPVPFNHFTHASSGGYKLACETCHHTGDREACTSCHKPLPIRNKDGTITSRSKRAFHLKCKGCHKELKKNKPSTTAPTTCKECHRMRSFETPKDGLSRNRAFHIQCIDCHEALRQNKAGNPPIKCTGCHRVPPSGKEHTFAELAGELIEKDPSEMKPKFVRDLELEKIKGPEHMVIDHAKASKSGTPFPHKKHQELGNDCYTCHHKGLEDPTCRSCHSDATSAKKAYHESCIPCHRENNIPAKCLDCHP